MDQKPYILFICDIMVPHSGILFPKQMSVFMKVIKNGHIAVLVMPS